jgi:hypothetical protein
VTKALVDTSPLDGAAGMGQGRRRASTEQIADSVRPEGTVEDWSSRDTVLRRP